MGKKRTSSTEVCGEGTQVCECEGESEDDSATSVEWWFASETWSIDGALVGFVHRESDFLLLLFLGSSSHFTSTL